MEEASDNNKSKCIEQRIQSQKELYRNEIRNRQIQRTICSKRLYLSNLISTNYQPSQIEIESPQNSELALKGINEAIRVIKEQIVSRSDTSLLIKCLLYLRNEMLSVLQKYDDESSTKDSERQCAIIAQLNEFILQGGITCLLELLQSHKYFETPEIVLYAITSVGNIFAFSYSPLLESLKREGATRFTIELLDACFQSYQLSESDMKEKILAETIRTLANIAGEGNSFKEEILSDNFGGFIYSDYLYQFLCKMPQISRIISEQLLFFIKNMLSGTLPTVFESSKKSALIRLLLEVFRRNATVDLPSEAIQDGIIAIQHAIGRSSSESSIMQLELIGQIISFFTSEDITNAYLSMQVMREWLERSHLREVGMKEEYEFENNVKSISRSFLSAIFNVISRKGAKNDLLIAAINGLIAFIRRTPAVEDRILMLFRSHFDIISQIIYIATCHSNNSVNYRAKTFLFDLICTACDRLVGEHPSVIQMLIEQDVLQILVDALTEDSSEMKVLGLKVIWSLLEIDEVEQQVKVKEQLVSMFAFESILEDLIDKDNDRQVSEHENQIGELANAILQAFFSSMNQN